MVLPELTVPFVGAVAPLQVTGALQSVPVHPVVHAHEKPVAPTVVQEPPFWQGFGEQPVLESMHTTAEPDQVVSA